MTYDVRCSCGKSFAVSPADAGASFDCPCGREVDIPPLHVLRADAPTSTDAVAQLHTASLGGLVTGAQSCGLCGSQTAHRVRAKIVYSLQARGDLRPTPAEAVGCLFLGWLPAMLLWGVRTKTPDEDAVTVPVPVCETCAAGLSDPETLKRALRTVPEYAAIFEQYPQATAARA